MRCPDCGGTLKLKASRFGKFYGCVSWPACSGTHGAHPDGRPLGTPAPKHVRQARRRAHEAFDPLWKDGGMKRREAYAWMAEAMGLTRDEAHIGRFTEPQCEALVEAIAAREEN